MDPAFASVQPLAAELIGRLLRDSAHERPSAAEVLTLLARELPSLASEQSRMFPEMRPEGSSEPDEVQALHMRVAELERELREQKALCAQKDIQIEGLLQHAATELCAAAASN